MPIETVSRPANARRAISRKNGEIWERQLRLRRSRPAIEAAGSLAVIQRERP